MTDYGTVIVIPLPVYLTMGEWGWRGKGEWTGRWLLSKWQDARKEEIEGEQIIFSSFLLQATSNIY